MRLSATLRPRRSTMIRSATSKTSGMRWLISTTAMPCALQVADVVQHLGHLPHRDRRRRLVHQHDLGVGEHGARDRHRLPLAARHLPDEVARPGLGLQVPEELARPAVHAAVVEDRRPARRSRRISRPRKTLAAAVRLLQSARSWWTISMPCRRASTGRCRTISRPSIRMRAVARGEVAGDHLDQRRLAGAVVAHQPDDLAGARSTSDTSFTAWMAPKCLEMLASSRTATLGLPPFGTASPRRACAGLVLAGRRRPALPEAAAGVNRVTPPRRRRHRRWPMVHDGHPQEPLTDGCRLILAGAPGGRCRSAMATRRKTGAPGPLAAILLPKREDTQ